MYGGLCVVISMSGGSPIVIYNYCDGVLVGISMDNILGVVGSIYGLMGAVESGVLVFLED